MRNHPSCRQTCLIIDRTSRLPSFILLQPPHHDTRLWSPLIHACADAWKAPHSNQAPLRRLQIRRQADTTSFQLQALLTPQHRRRRACYHTVAYQPDFDRRLFPDDVGDPRELGRTNPSATFAAGLKAGLTHLARAARQITKEPNNRTNGWRMEPLVLMRWAKPSGPARVTG